MLREWPAFHALAKTFAEGPVCLRIAGLTGAARALAVAELVQAHPRPAVVLVESVPDAHRWTQDLKFFGAPALEFPEPEPRLWRGGRQREADAERAVICWRLAANEPVVVVVTPAALDAELAAPPEFAARTLRLAVGDSLDREPLLAALERAGYERVDTVVEVGQWSLRGGIVDVFSPSLVSPARGRARAVARRGVQDSPRRVRRAPGRAPAPDPARARARGSPGGGARRGHAARARRWRRLRRVLDPGTRRDRPHRGRDLRRSSAPAAAAEVPARRRAHGIHRSRGWRRRGPRGPRARALPGPQDDDGRRPRRRFPRARVRGGQPALPACRAPRPRLEVPGRRRERRAPRPPGRRRVAAREGVGARLPPRDGRGAAPTLRPARGRGGARVLPRHALAARVRGGLPLRGDAGPVARDRRGQARHGVAPADGPAGRRRRRLRQDRGGAPRRVKGGRRRHAGGGARAHDGPRPAALDDVRRPVRALPGARRAE